MTMEDAAREAREGARPPMPQPNYKDALERLLEALVRQCEQAEAVSSEAGVTTAWIRRLVILNKDRYFP